MATLAIHRIGLQRIVQANTARHLSYRGVVQHSAFVWKAGPTFALSYQTDDGEDASEEGQAAVCERTTDSGAGAAGGGRGGGGGARGGGDRRMRGRRRRGGGRPGADGGRRRDRGRAEHDSLMSKDTSRGLL